MEITINYYGQAVSVSVEVYEYLTQADHKAENLAHEQRRHWDGREFDEYIISTEGRLPYCATPEELICQRETLDEILAVLALCTPTQRERFLLYALHDFSYAEIAEMCGCTKVAVYYSIEAVRKKFLKFFRNLLNDCPPKWLPGEGCLLHHRAFYSLGAFDWTENYALEHSPSPEQLVMLAEERAERDRLAAALREALAYATPTQARRICAYYLGGLTQQQIADQERVHNSNVCLSIRRGCATSTATTQTTPRESEGGMAIINLRKHYYPLYTKDTFIEVPDEVAAVMEECRLYENRQEGRKKYYHVYSMDCTPAIENHAMFLVQSPEDLIIREIDETAEELLLAHLAEAIIQLSPTQARRLHARYALKKKFREIAADEGVSGSCATESVTSAVRKLRKIFAQNGWLEKEPPMANKLPNATAGMTFPRPKPDTPPSMVKKIGKTTYLVWAHFSETSTETMEDKIKRMLREEVRQMMADE